MVRTPWIAIFAVTAAGMAAAAQIGKVPAALTTIAAELGLSLAAASLLVSLFGLMAAAGGLAIGMAAGRLGARRALLAGGALGALSALGAALAPGFGALLAARILEGAGFLLVTVTAPGIVAAAATGRDRSSAMAVWGTYMPIGVALGLLSAPLIESLGWRAAWIGHATLLGLATLAAARLAPAGPPPTPGGEGARALLRALIRARRPLWLAVCFGSYNVLYVGISSFLPARLEALGQGTGAAGLLAAGAALANAAGNLTGGVLTRRGHAASTIVQLAAPVMAGLAAAIFLLPDARLAALAGLLACLLGGVIPAACFAALPGSVPRAALVASATGLVIQANNIAQLLAPPLIGLLAGLDWRLAALPLLLAGAISAFAGRKLR